MKFNIAICDDNPIELNEERKLIEDELAKCEVEYEMDIFGDSAKLLESDKVYTFVFLDVEMEGMNGIKTAAKIHEVNNKCLIFFVTNHENYMDEALNKHAFRFWTKPIDKTRLSYGIKSAIEEINSRRKFLKVNVDKKETHILINNIIYAYTENRISKIITTDGELETKDLFKKIKSQLDGGSFCEVHASYCVNFSYVCGYSSTEVICQNNGKRYKIEMSKRKSPIFKKSFARWSGGMV